MPLIIILVVEKKLLSLWLVLAAFLFNAQLPAFTVTLTGTAETCNGNGSLSWETKNTTPGASIVYQVINTVTSVSIGSTSNTFYSGLSAGSYKVVAKQSLNAQSNTAESNVFVITDKRKPLSFTGNVVSNEICGNDGSYRLYVTSGTEPYRYQLLDANQAVILEQSGDTFQNLTAGTYQYRVIDNCGNGQIGSFTISRTPSNLTDVGLFSTLISCTEIRTRINPIGVIKYPVTISAQYTDPNTSQVMTVSRSNIPSNDFNINLPFFPAKTNLSVQLTITDACGVVKSFTKLVDYTTTYKVSKAAASCSSQALEFRFDQGMQTSFKVRFTAFPAGFDPLQSNPNHDTFRTEHIYGALGNKPLPGGTYQYEIVDRCGRITPGSEVISKTVFGIQSINQNAQCGTNLTSVYFQPDTGFAIASAQITAAPQAFIDQFGPLPFAIPEAWFYVQSSVRRFLLQNMPPGDYTITAIDSCSGEQASLQRTFEGNTLLPAPSITLTTQCDGKYKVSSLGNPSLHLQKYYPEVDGWGLTLETARKDGSGKLHTGSSINIGSSLNDTWGPGTYRIVTDNYRDSYYYYLENGELQGYYCDKRVLQTFTIGASPTVGEAYGFYCTGGNINMYVNAQSTSGIANYSIVSGNGNDATVVFDNGTNQLFKNLAPGNYFVRVTDLCGNFTTKKIATSELVTPQITPNYNCNTGFLSLVTNNYSFLNYEWYKISDPSKIISTNYFAILDTYGSDKAGEYAVRMSAKDGDICINNVATITLTAQAFTNPSAGTGQMVNINASEVNPVIDLFDYLTGTVDTYGTWTEITQPYTSGLLTGRYFNISKAAPRAYTFRYAVKSPCGTATNSSEVTIIISKKCYKLPVTNAGLAESTLFGITSLGRAGADADNWPMVRKGGWLALESNNLGFVMNRVAFDLNNLPVGIPVADFVEGMMVYDTTNNCLKIYNGTYWSCFTSQDCPD